MLKVTKFNDRYLNLSRRSVASDHAYDAASILLNNVLPKADSLTKSGRLAQKVKAMYAVKDYEGVSGTLSMKEDGRIDVILIRLYQLENMVPVRQ